MRLALGGTMLADYALIPAVCCAECLHYMIDYLALASRAQNFPLMTS